MSTPEGVLSLKRDTIVSVWRKHQLMAKPEVRGQEHDGRVTFGKLDCSPPVGNLQCRAGELGLSSL